MWRAPSCRAAIAPAGSKRDQEEEPKGSSEEHWRLKGETWSGLVCLGCMGCMGQTFQDGLQCYTKIDIENAVKRMLGSIEFHCWEH